MNLSNSFVFEKSSGRPLARFPENSNYEKAMLELCHRFTSEEFSGNASLLADSECYGDVIDGGCNRFVPPVITVLEQACESKTQDRNLERSEGYGCINA
jgi:hypothetical protein